jgi:hypothetical protein
MSPKWSPIASEDLRAIGNSLVAAEVFHIASAELRPDTDDALEGALEHPEGARYRRCVRTTELHRYTSFDLDDDVDDFRNQACDYILIYRPLTKDEQINLKLLPGLVVLRVVSNVDLVDLVTRTRPDK